MSPRSEWRSEWRAARAFSAGDVDGRMSKREAKAVVRGGRQRRRLEHGRQPGKRVSS